MFQSPTRDEFRCFTSARVSYRVDGTDAGTILSLMFPYYKLHAFCCDSLQGCS